jgi:rfaE bifunctional protein nucleotidyltransferase chain/domain
MCEHPVVSAFANGTFDMCHAGHVSFLKWASESGQLFVGVNSDASVRQLKGEKRPIVCEADRLAVVRALRFVWRAELFDGRTPLDMLRQVLPDVYCIGADHSLDDECTRFVICHGGKVVQYPDVHMRSRLSTTDIIRRAQNREATHTGSR